MPLNTQQAGNIDRFFTAVKSLNELDTKEIRNVVSGILSPSVLESYYTLHYHRAAINIELILTLKELKQFQAITMLARSIMETAVEMRLMRADPSATSKIGLFEQVQKLKAGKKIVEFKARHPEAKVHVETYEQYIAAHEARIVQEKLQMWPGARWITHWTLMSMEERCKTLGNEFDALYQVHYAQLSWYVHSGITGVANMTGEALSVLCGMAFRIIVECYAAILEVVINVFKIYHADDKLKKKITFAKMLPFTDTQEQIDGLANALGL
jgi:hypothetical protein